MTQPLDAMLDRTAEVAEAEGGSDGWGDVLAVAVIHAEGVRVMAYPRDLAAADPTAIRSHLADLSEMLLRGRREALS